jgi:hypothetical protein
MTHAIHVPTPFTDIAELAESFAQRADEERLMLPHHEPVPEGEWVQFTVTFADGSGALVGVGRCTGAYDNGEDRAAEHRFDIVMDALELDEMSQIYFERVLMARAAQVGAEPATGEVPVEGYGAESFDAAVPVDDVVSFEHEPAEAYAAPEIASEPVAFDASPVAYDAPEHHAEDVTAFAAPIEASSYEPAPYEPAAYEPAPYEAASYDAPQEVYALGEPDAPAASFDAPVAEPAAAYAPAYEAAPPEPAPESGETQLGVLPPLSQPAPRLSTGERLKPPVHAIYALPAPKPPGRLPTPHAEGPTPKRRRVAASWSPQPALRPEPSESSGFFQYGDHGLPRPAQPARPAIDPSLRVLRAPRKSDPLAIPVMRSVAAAAAVAYAEEAVAAEPAYAPPVYQESDYADPSAAEYADAAYDEGQGGYASVEDLGDGAFGDAEPVSYEEPVEMSDAYVPSDETVQVELPDDDDRY